MDKPETLLGYPIVYDDSLRTDELILASPVKIMAGCAVYRQVVVWNGQALVEVREGGEGGDGWKRVE